MFVERLHARHDKSENCISLFSIECFLVVERTHSKRTVVGKKCHATTATVLAQRRVRLVISTLLYRHFGRFTQAFRLKLRPANILLHTRARALELAYLARTYMCLRQHIYAQIIHMTLAIEAHTTPIDHNGNKICSPCSYFVLFIHSFVGVVGFLLRQFHSHEYTNIRVIVAENCLYQY